MEWIDVKTKLPDEGKLVWVRGWFDPFDSTKTYLIGRRYGSVWKCHQPNLGVQEMKTSDDKHCGVHEWMPLPENAKEMHDPAQEA